MTLKRRERRGSSIRLGALLSRSAFAWGGLLVMPASLRVPSVCRNFTLETAAMLGSRSQGLQSVAKRENIGHGRRLVGTAPAQRRICAGGNFDRGPSPRRGYAGASRHGGRRPGRARAAAPAPPIPLRRRPPSSTSCRRIRRPSRASIFPAVTSPLPRPQAQSACSTTRASRRPISPTRPINWMAPIMPRVP